MYLVTATQDTRDDGTFRHGGVQWDCNMNSSSMHNGDIEDYWPRRYGVAHENDRGTKAKMTHRGSGWCLVAEPMVVLAWGRDTCMHIRTLYVWRGQLDMKAKGDRIEVATGQ